jgi:hypothetical protein
MWSAASADCDSNPHIVFGCSRASFMPGVQHTTRLDEQYLDFMFGVGLMFHAFGNDKHLSSSEVNFAFAKIDPQVAFNHKERFIRILVIMPNEVALQFRELELIIIHLSDDFRSPLLRKEPEFLLEIDRLEIQATLR